MPSPTVPFRYPPPLPITHAPPSAPVSQLFKTMPQPSRLESLLISSQMHAYCQQINQFSGQSFAKLFLMQSLNQK